MCCFFLFCFKKYSMLFNIFFNNLYLLNLFYFHIRFDIVRFFYSYKLYFDLFVFHLHLSSSSFLLWNWFCLLKCIIFNCAISLKQIKGQTKNNVCLKTFHSKYEEIFYCFCDVDHNLFHFMKYLWWIIFTEYELDIW